MTTINEEEKDIDIEEQIRELDRELLEESIKLKKLKLQQLSAKKKLLNKNSNSNTNDVDIDINGLDNNYNGDNYESRNKYFPISNIPDELMIEKHVIRISVPIIDSKLLVLRVRGIIDI
jgi:hypothetical protein